MHAEVTNNSISGRIQYNIIPHAHHMLLNLILINWILERICFCEPFLIIILH